MTKPRTPNPYRLTARLSVPLADGTLREITVRYTDEIDREHFLDLIRRARWNRNGKCKAGPVVVTVHPDDRASR